MRRCKTIWTWSFLAAALLALVSCDATQPPADPAPQVPMDAIQVPSGYGFTTRTYRCLQITVHDHNNNAYPNAVVTACTPEGDEIATAVTDSEGFCRLMLVEHAADFEVLYAVHAIGVPQDSLAVTMEDLGSCDD